VRAYCSRGEFSRGADPGEVPKTGGEVDTEGVCHRPKEGRMPEEVDRSATGVRGVFPFRFPVGTFLALVSFLLLIPVWWKVGEMATPRIKTYYAKTYWKTFADGWTLVPGACRNEACIACWRSGR
jgi:hypothetical protein